MKHSKKHDDSLRRIKQEWSSGSLPYFSTFQELRKILDKGVIKADWLHNLLDETLLQMSNFYGNSDNTINDLSLLVKLLIVENDILRNMLEDEFSKNINGPQELKL